MSPALPEVAVVVVNIDGGESLFAALASVPVDSAGVELIVVDNGSRREEIEAIRLNFPYARLIELGSNHGFADASNRGIAATSAPFVLLLNNDATLGADCLPRLCHALRADPSLAAVQALVLDGAGERIDTAGIRWNPRGEAVPVAHGAVPPRGEATPFTVAGVSATATLYRRAALAEVAQGPDVLCSRFFAYYEDVDLSLRLLRRGWRTACDPMAQAFHRGSLTGRRWPWRRERLLMRNRWWTLRRNFSRRFLARSLGPLLRADLAHARQLGWRGGWLLAALPASIAGAPLLAPPHAGETLSAFPRVPLPVWLGEDDP